jgi:hypothetical protein
VTENKAPRDTRKHARHKAGFDVMVGTADGPKVAGDISLDALDLSESGAFLHSDLLFEEGEMLYLEIPLSSSKVISVTGRVARVSKEADGGAGMGIEFINLLDDDRKLLAANLAQLIAAAS